MAAYYNEFEPQAAAWLRELIKGGHIADGEVDERSIIDVRPDELREFKQCHFFAGIGVWSYALRSEGWPDDAPVWTGSCPCQPFSAAGKGDGFADERHLWPHFHWLIEQCAPAIVFGEQVASKAVEPWIDLVQFDVEALGYAFGCVAFPAAGVGSPNIRDRAYWVADAAGDRRIGSGSSAKAEEGLRPRSAERGQLSDRLEGCGLSGEQQAALHGIRGMGDALRIGQHTGRNRNNIGDDRPILNANGENGGLADATAIGCLQGRQSDATQECDGIAGNGGNAAGRSTAGATNGFWRNADWLLCRDDKWRPVEPGTFPLADGSAARMGRLRGYGNAINAKAFVRAYLDCRA